MAWEHRKNVALYVVLGQQVNLTHKLILLISVLIDFFLFHFINLTHLWLSEKRESQLKNFFQQIRLLAILWCIILIKN